MHRALVLALLAALVLAGCNRNGENSEDPGVTVTTPPSPPPWAPPPVPTPGSIDVSPNDTWRYERRTNETTEDILARIVAVTNDTVRMRTTTTDLATNATTATVSLIDRETLALIELEDGKLNVRMRFDPPLPIVIPASNHTYAGNVTVPTFLGNVVQPATGNVTFLGFENVTVPNGTFETYHYDAWFRTEGAFTFEQHIEMWFAPAVGQAVKTITDGRVQELVAYDRNG